MSAPAGKQAFVFERRMTGEQKQSHNSARPVHLCLKATNSTAKRRMPDKAFLDTNVLVYAFSSDGSRNAIAKDLMIRGATVGVQTLNEFVNVERNKVRVSWEKVLGWLRIIESNT